MQWPAINYAIYSFQSGSDCIISIPRRVKARYYIQFRIQLNRNESPRETKRCFSRFQIALYAVARNKVYYAFIRIKV
jgi:hypothetical protein